MAINNPLERLKAIEKANATPNTKDGVKANTSKGVGNSGKTAAGTGSTNITLRNGSTGVDVKNLQKALIAEGYNVGKAGADGVYGNATAAAVRKYQQDHGLAVDGIAGKNTLGSLYGSTNSGSKPVTTTVTMKPVTTGGNAKPVATKTTIPGNVIGQKRPETPAHTTTSTPTTPATTVEQPVIEDFTYTPYEVTPFEYSDTVKQAFAVIDQLKASKPGEWVDPYLDQRKGYLDQYENRGPFSYDFNSDALYNQYKDQYIQQGQMAMMDTMGQAAAMTGGYGNSYAQSVGQQAYNQQLSQLNNVMPELYQMAYDRYAQEGQDLLNMYDLYAGLSAEDYGKYRDSVTDYYSELDSAWDSAKTLYDMEYNEWADETQLGLDTWAKETGLAYDEWAAKNGWNQDNYWNSIDMAYKEGRDAIEDEQWQAKFDREGQQTNYNNLAGLISSTGYTPSASELAAAGMTESEAKALKDGYTASISKTGNPDSTKYRELSISDRSVLQKDVERAGSLAALKSLVKQYVAMRYDPELIDALTADKAASFMGGGGGPGGTEVDALPSYYPFASQAEKDKYEARQKNQSTAPTGTIDWDDLEYKRMIM
jgi:peptidoglycan hydrolase-like protein with peptidoglycan-binding domain